MTENTLIITSLYYFKLGTKYFRELSISKKLD